MGIPHGPSLSRHPSTELIRFAYSSYRAQMVRRENGRWSIAGMTALHRPHNLGILARNESRREAGAMNSQGDDQDVLDGIENQLRTEDPWLIANFLAFNSVTPSIRPPNGWYWSTPHAGDRRTDRPARTDRPDRTDRRAKERRAALILLVIMLALIAILIAALVWSLLS